MIYVTGDIHGSIDISKLSNKKWKEQKNLTEEDVLIVCGDFGLIWNNTPDGEERYWLDWLSEKAYTILFVDGNHENHERLKAMPIEYKFQGKVHKLRDNVYHLLRGEIYMIDGKKILTIGGAKSIDKAFRKEGISWWKDEELNYAEAEAILKNIEDKGNNKFDIIISHAAPIDVVKKMFQYTENSYTEQFLNHILAITECPHWYFGHYHIDNIYTIGGSECVFHAMYDNIERII